MPDRFAEDAARLLAARRGMFEGHQALDEFFIRRALRRAAMQPRCDYTVFELPSLTNPPSTALLPVWYNGQLYSALLSSLVPAVSNINSPYAYNVKVYGALGNGTNDDTAAIQTAITAAGVTGGVVSFPQGIYLISSTLWVPSNVSLIGSGINATFVRGAASMTNVSLIAAGPSVGSSYGNALASHGSAISVREMTVDGSLLPSSANCYGVNLSYVDYLRILNCRFYKIPGYGTLVGANAATSSANNTLNGIIAFCIYDSCGGNNNADSAGGGNCSDEIFAFNYTTTAFGTAADRVNPLRWTVAFNRSVSPNYFNGTSGFYKSDCGMAGGGFYFNDLEGGGGINANGYLASSSGLFGPPSDVEFTGNRINGSGGSGIAVSAGNQSNAGTSVATRMRFSNNEILSPYNNCISLVDAQDCSIVGGTMKDWNQAAAGSGSSQYAIAVASNGINSQKNSYRGVSFVSTTANPKLYSESQLPSSSGLPNNNVLEDCTVDASGTPTASLWTANLPQTVLRNISGMPPISTGWSTPAVPASTGSVTNQTPYDMWVVLSGFTALQVSLNGIIILSSATGGSFHLKTGSAMALNYTGGAGTMTWAPV